MRSLFLGAAAVLAAGVAAVSQADDPGSIVRRQRAFNPVVGAAKIQGANNNDIYPRQPLDALQNDADVWNMFILAMESLQNVPEDQTLSWYQIGGIHGAPYVPWDYPVPNDIQRRRFGIGYCTHSSVLFVTWHRPYIALAEQSLVQHALRIAGQFSGQARTRYQNAARRVRMPYWDAFDQDVGGSFPAILRQDSITVTKPTGRTAIPNPLSAYRFQEAFSQKRQQELSAAGMFGSFASDDQTSRDTQDGVIASQLASRRQLAYDTFSLPNFSKFSTQAYVDGRSPDTSNSVEQIHNAIHNYVGGYMAYTTYAGFDPVFFFHHANIDRLATLYQAAHPESIDGRNAVVQPFTGAETFAYPTRNHREDINTLLYPFRRSTGREWTSRDVSSAKSIYTFGYSYPELPAEFNGRSDADLRNRALTEIDRLYNTRRGSSARGGGRRSRGQGNGFFGIAKRNAYGTVNSTAPYVASNHSQSAPSEVGTEWYATVIFNANDLQDVFGIFPYLGKEPTCASDKNIAGAVSGLGLAMDKMVSGNVPLNHILVEHGIDTDDVQAVVEYLKKNLNWKVYSGSKLVEVDVNKIKTLKVGVSAAQCAYFDNDPTKLPVKGEWATFYEATEGKTGGMSYEEDRTKLKSVDVTNVGEQGGSCLKSPVITKIETVYVCPDSCPN